MLTLEGERRMEWESTSKQTFLIADATPRRRIMEGCSVKTVSFVIGMIDESRSCGVVK